MKWVFRLRSERRESETERSYQTSKLDRFVEQLVVDDALLGVGRLPGQLDAGFRHLANLKLPRLARHCGEHRTVNLDSPFVYRKIVFEK